MVMFFSFLYGLTVLLMCLLIFTILFSKRNKSTYYFSFTLFSLLFWMFTLFLLYNVDENFRYLLEVGRVNFAFGMCVLPFANLFILNFPRIKKNKFELLILGQTLILVFFTIFTDFIVVKEEIIGGNLITTYGKGYPVFVVHFLFYAITLIYNSLVKFRNSDISDKPILKILFFANIVAIPYAILTTIIVPMVFLSTELIDVKAYTLLQNLSIFSVYFYSIPIAYIILRYHFLDIRILFGEILHRMVLSFFTLLYVLVCYFLFVWVYPILDFFVIFLILFITYVFVAIYSSISPLVKKIIKSKIVSPDFDEEEIEQNFKTQLDNILHVKGLLELIKREVFERNFVESLVIMINSQSDKWEKHHLGEGSHDEQKLKILFSKYSNLINKGGVFTPIFLDRLAIEIPREFDNSIPEVKELVSLAQNLKISAIVPITNKAEMLGVFLISRKVDLKSYNSNDVRFWDNIASYIGWALSRMFLYQEVEEFTKTLQKKVDEQTKELRQSLQNMEKMRQREKDLVDMMGHELRTPLTIVKNSLELVEIYKKNKKKENKEIVWDGNFQKQFEYIKAAVRREMGIVETLLSATKLDAKKIEPHFSEVDLLKVIDTTLLGFEKEAAKKGLKVKIDIDKSKKWVIRVDSLQVQQVVDNLVSNAVKYTAKGHVKISLKDLGSKISVIVSDTGEGMDKASVSRLGQKFHRVNHNNGNGNQSKALVRPGGTGLGLFVAFGLVKVNGGTHDVQSQVGKGSTFTVTFKKP